MGYKRIPVTCSVCKESTALIGEDIDKKYTVEHFTAKGWVFSKYKTMCPECVRKEKERIEQQMKMDI